MTQMHPHVKIKWDETSSEADWHEPAALYMYDGGHTGDVAMPPQPSCGFTYNMENACEMEKCVVTSFLLIAAHVNRQCLQFPIKQMCISTAVWLVPMVTSLDF